MLIRNVRNSDAQAIAEIYNYYIRNTIISFEEEELDAHEMRLRFLNVCKDLPWLVCEDKGEVIAYAYASRWNARKAYNVSAEFSIYAHHKKRSKGAGTLLYTKLFEEIRKLKYHTVMAGVSLPNDESVGFHEKFGFEKVAHFKEVGFKLNQFIDVAYWQIML